MERAARRDGIQARHGAIDLHQAAALRRDARNGAHQADGIGMFRRMNHVAHAAHLDDAAGVHHRHAVRRLGDHPHVVRDQHHRGAALGGEALEQRDDLRLDRHIERGGRLVGDQQARLGGERERDHHALAHAAGELVRIVVVARLRARDADFAEQS